MNIFTLFDSVFRSKKLLIGLLLAGAINCASAGEAHLLVLNYHDIVSADKTKQPTDVMDVSIDHLEEHFAWLKNNGYNIISVQEVFDAAAGKKALPNNSVVLSFDDGYQSFHDLVLPLLKKYHYSASLALVGEWMEGKDLPGKPLLSWDQVRGLVESGLVEIASHTYNQHKGIAANPQGSMQAAVITREYHAQTGKYESDAEYTERLRTSMIKSAEFIFQHAGIRPRVMVWPYGEYNQLALAAA
ncbi:MAG: polysaccharide deacetylase family protein, partial [Methylococcales bacterium]